MTTNSSSSLLAGIGHQKKRKTSASNKALIATALSVTSNQIHGHLRLEIVKLETDSKQPKLVSIPYDQIVLLQSHFIGCRYQNKADQNKQEWKQGMLAVYFNETLQFSIGRKSILDALFHFINPDCNQLEWMTELPNESERKEATFYHLLFAVECSETPLDWSKQKQTDYTKIPMILAPENVSVEMWYPNLLAKQITTKTMNALISILVDNLGLSK